VLDIVQNYWTQVKIFGPLLENSSPHMVSQAGDGLGKSLRIREKSVKIWAKSMKMFAKYLTFRASYLKIRIDMTPNVV